MTTSVTYRSHACEHYNHLFESPLCSKLTTQQKIRNIVFHIFTLGLPLALYKIIQKSLYRKYIPTPTVTPPRFSTVIDESIQIRKEPLTHKELKDMLDKDKL